MHSRRLRRPRRARPAVAAVAAVAAVRPTTRRALNSRTRDRRPLTSIVESRRCSVLSFALALLRRRRGALAVRTRAQLLSLGRLAIRRRAALHVASPGWDGLIAQRPRGLDSRGA